MGRRTQNDEITDLTRGIYRRQYSGFVAGKRINRVSLEAEAWFWRVHAAADDFGNVPADPHLLYGATAGRRMGVISIDKMTALVEELAGEGLLQIYTAEGDRFYHVAGWLELQPAGKNGKRARRMPASPWDGGSDDPALASADARDHGAERKATKTQGLGQGETEKGESKGIQGNPGFSGRHNHQDNYQDQDQDNAPAAQAAAEIGDGAHAPIADSSAREPQQQADPDRDDRVLMTFPCDGRPPTWVLRQSRLDQLAELFPALDLMAECRAAYAHVLANPRKKKTASGMPAYLTSWMTRSTNNPRMRAKPQEADHSPDAGKMASGTAMRGGSSTGTRPGVVDRRLAFLESNPAGANR